MKDPQIDVLAVALDELESSLQDHVDRAADLVVEAEAAGQVGHAHHVQLERIATLLDRAQSLRESVENSASCCASSGLKCSSC